MPLPLEIEHAVHHVLQHLGSGDGALLVHMPDDKYGDIFPLGQLHQCQGAFLYLAYAAWGGGHIPVVQGLDGVHDEHVGLELVDGVHQVLQIGLCQQIEALAPHAEPLGPQLDLPLRLLP